MSSRNGMIPGEKPYTKEERKKVDDLLREVSEAEELYKLDELEEAAVQLEAYNRFLRKNPEYWSGVFDSQERYLVFSNPCYRALGSKQQENSFSLSGTITGEH